EAAYARATHSPYYLGGLLPGWPECCASTGSALSPSQWPLVQHRGRGVALVALYRPAPEPGRPRWSADTAGAGWRDSRNPGGVRSSLSHRIASDGTAVRDPRSTSRESTPPAYGHCSCECPGHRGRAVPLGDPGLECPGGLTPPCCLGREVR